MHTGAANTYGWNEFYTPIRLAGDDLIFVWNSKDKRRWWSFPRQACCNNAWFDARSLRWLLLSFKGVEVDARNLYQAASWLIRGRVVWYWNYRSLYLDESRNVNEKLDRVIVYLIQERLKIKILLSREQNILNIFYISIIREVSILIDTINLFS